MIWLDGPSATEIANLALDGHAVVRDAGLLDSALARAQNAYFYMGVSMFQAAAYYAAGIAKNHPFVDGNKRVGWALATAFLRANGYRVKVLDETKSTAAMVGLASGDLTVDYMAGFLEGCASLA